MNSNLTSFPVFPVVLHRGTLVADDLHLYDVRCGKWTTPNILPRPMGRFAHAACTGGGDNVVVFGGVNPEEDLTDVVVITAP